MPLPHNTPELRSLDLFSTVVQVGSLSRAAHIHHMSQPSASARMRQLERLLEVDLLIRTSTGVKPTEAGTVIAEWADRALEAAQELMAGSASMVREDAARLQIAASYTVAEYLLPRWLASFHRQHPLVAVELEVGNSSQIAQLVKSGSAVLGFIESPAPPSFLESSEVARDELVLIVAPTHAWARRRKPLPPRTLCSTALVMRERGSGTREALEHELANLRNGEPPPAVLELGSTAAVKAAVMDGAGPAVVSNLAVEADVRDGHLVVVPVEGVGLHRRLRAVWKPDVSLPLSASQLLTYLGRSRP